MKIFGYFWDLEKLHVEIPEMIYLWIYIYIDTAAIFETEFTFTKSASDFSVFKSPKIPWKKSHAFHGNNCAAAMMASVPTIPGTWTRCRVGTFGASLTSDLARPCQRQVPRCGVSGGNKVGRPWPRTQGVFVRFGLGNPVGESLAVNSAGLWYNPYK